MFALRYLNEEEVYCVEFQMFSGNLVEITGEFPIKSVGFELSRMVQDIPGLPEEEQKDFWDGWDYS